MAAQIPYSAGNPQQAGSDEASIKVNSTTGDLQLNVAGTIKAVPAMNEAKTIFTGVPISKTISFTEGGAAGTLTGTITIPAGATLIDIQVVVTVLFGAGTSAVLDVGDADDADGWFAGVSVKATDLVVGEVLSIKNVDNWGAKQGVYLVAATGRMGRTTAGVDSGVYYGAASTVKGVITTVGTASTAGRAFMTVTYVGGDVTAATYVAT